MAQHTVYPTITDTYIDQANPTTNYASSTSLLIKDWVSPVNVKSMYMLFDLSGIPARKQIISATLSLYKNSANSEAPGVKVSKVNSDIAIVSITYNNKPSGQVDYYTDDTAGFAAIPLTIGSFSRSITQLISDIYASGSGMVLFWAYSNSIETHSFNSIDAASNKPSLTVVYEDVFPSAPIPTEPIGLFKDNKAITRFAWTYNSSVGGTQKAFDLQWSVDQSTWTTISQTTTNNYYDLAADTLPAGNIYWRVRCYNDYDEVSSYCSTQAFYAIGAPAIPAINAVPTNSARPVITWSAFNQQIYQLQILSGTTMVYDSGNKPSIFIRSHKVTAFLSDGTYTVNLRIKNEYDLWSDWGTNTFTISITKPDQPTLSITNTSYGLQAKTSMLGIDKMFLYKDGICTHQGIKNISDNLVINGNRERGIAYWVPYNSTVSIVEDNNKFKVITSGGGAIGVATIPIAVKAYTDYYVSGNITDGTCSGQLYVLKAGYVQTIKTGVGAFNTGDCTNLIIYLNNEADNAYCYYDSIMLIEGDDAPEAYKTYKEDYLVSENTSENGKLHKYEARVIYDVAERQVINLLASDGDCEDVSKWGLWNSSLALDGNNKIYGSNSIKVTSAAAGIFSLVKYSFNVIVGRKYLLSAYVKIGATTNPVYCVPTGSLYIDQISATSDSQFTNIGAKFVATVSTPNIEIYGIATAAGETFFVDGVMLSEIIDDDKFYSLSSIQLFARYPFGNGTFTAQAYEVYNDSDPVNAAASFTGSLIAPVSDLTDVYSVTKSLSSQAKRNYNRNQTGASVVYAGRAYPVYEPSEHATSGISFAFYVATYAEVESFIALHDQKETVLYRDASGRKIYGTLNGLNVTDEIPEGYTISCAISQVDYIEELEV